MSEEQSAEMQGRVALVTGASRGIGRAISERLARDGMTVVLVARSFEELSDVRAAIRDAGGEALAYPCDITRPDDVDALRRDIELELGSLAVLVHNAGVAPSAKIESTTDELWRSTFAVNVDGPFYLTRSLLPMLRESLGDIVAVASTAALQGFKYTIAYTASKHALLGFMRALNEEVRSSGIRLSTLCPGFVRTSILEASIQNIMTRTGKDRGAAEAALAAMNREGRLIEPREIAETVCQLIHDRNLVSGNAYYADGTLIEQVDF
jgi:NAD(P)-dependent dehydrogenase (short-subunit alcohol dehydrogenase family)